MIAAIVLAFMYPLNKKTINAVDDELRKINRNN